MNAVFINWRVYASNLLASTSKGVNFDECKSGGLHEMHEVANWNLRRGEVSGFRGASISKSVCAYTLQTTEK
jgi:hypothetical protein